MWFRVNCLLDFISIDFELAHQLRTDDEAHYDRKCANTTLKACYGGNLAVY